MRVETATFGLALISAVSGNGGTGPGGNGGAGGVGRIRAEYCKWILGSTNPPASVDASPDDDSDTVSNECDPCPANPDCDGDGYNDAIELRVRTNPVPPGGFCSADSTADNEEPDARPTDLNDDRAVSGADLSAIAAEVGTSVPPAPVRKDIAPDPAGDNAISGADLSRVAAVIGTAC
ncbi:MAG: hypothetical protein HYS09_02705 [Chloroflexi bacterium]|nr:hypothetical protein [Chloroflexota bacterium]